LNSRKIRSAVEEETNNQPLEDEVDVSNESPSNRQLQLLLKPESSGVSQASFDSGLCSMLLTDMMPLPTCEPKSFEAF
jgi:hypothetical protein